MRRARIIRAAAVILAAVLTVTYVFMLLALTGLSCMHRNVGCAEGWLARSLWTVIYLAAVTGVVTATRSLLRGTDA